MCFSPPHGLTSSPPLFGKVAGDLPLFYFYKRQAKNDKCNNDRR